ncbi:MAG: nicotinate phosphoribosyltransferase, partial [bacterium]|nr:nicotinate phosphoribosyltransferase [bacterium]
MSLLKKLYSQNLVLLTDLYQLTMAYGYWKSGLQDHQSVFHLSFRENPFKGGYAVACGLETAIEFLSDFHFEQSDIDYLSSLKGNDSARLFEQDFLDYLLRLEFVCSIDAIPEGTVVFPHEPLVRVTGPLLQAQIIETSLLNIINFQTLIATKASRIVEAAQGEPILEFGLRRAQGIDGSLSASRAAYIGGCSATSNVLAGKLFDIPVKGTQAHSWVMCFDSEVDAFAAYAEALPNNCIFLVDTYDSLAGVRNAVTIGKQLRQKGHEMIGIRLDSGDLAYLSIEARKILDENGFPNAVIVASNDLDEHIITSLKRQGAKIMVWGVGTKLVTGHDQPALGGVYKLSAIRKNNHQPWSYRIKLSDHAINPVGDMIFDLEMNDNISKILVDPMDATRRKSIDKNADESNLLIPIFRDGSCIYHIPDIHSVRNFAAEQIKAFHPGIRRLLHPHEYPVGLELSLFKHKTKLIMKAKGYVE